MQIHHIANLDRREPSDALVVAYFTDQYERPELGHLQEICLGPIRAGDFTAKEAEVVTLWGPGPEEKRIIMVGLGSKEHASLEGLRKSYAQAVKTCLKYSCKRMSVLVPEIESLDHEAALKALCEGLFLGGDKIGSYIEEVTLVGPELHLMQKVSDKVKKVMTAVYRARELINGNADTVTPEFIARFATDMSQEFGRIKTEVKDKAWIQEQNMHLFLAVARAAHTMPRFIICSYQGKPLSQDHTVLVGKGITYDTGGLKLKSLDSMLTMRCDMAGAAISLAVIEAISALGLPVNVTCVIAACENAISEKAYKLGDVYPSRSGATVEVTNTDAEGRLVVADAISYAVDTLKPSRIIDIGTFTGSMEIALGNELMGLFSNSDSLAQELFYAGQRTHERMWRMPLYEEYKDQLQSEIADIKNAATQKSGSILCAKFIEHFVQNVPWAHLDVASVSFAKETKGYLPKNATGIGIRLLVDYFEHLSKASYDT